MDAKICKKCKKLKKISEFYIHKKMADGYLNFCKECVRGRVHDHYYLNVMESRKQEKKRYERRKNQKSYKDMSRKGKKMYKKRHHITGLKKLYKNRPEICELCHRNKDDIVGQLHAHHINYNKPDEIIWLCSVCHIYIHNKGKFRQLKIN